MKPAALPGLAGEDREQRRFGRVSDPRASSPTLIGGVLTLCGLPSLLAKKTEFPESLATMTPA